VIQCRVPLLLIGEHGGDTMMAHIAMMRALNRHQPKPTSAPRRKRAKVYKRRYIEPMR